MKPFFSIIIPTLNEENYLPKLLTALNAQTFTDFEVIVVDAHSEDNTQKIAIRFDARYKLTVINSKHRNLSFQKNLAAKLATGTYIFFVDADMYFSEYYLSKLSDYLQTTHADFASTSLQYDHQQFVHRLWFAISNNWKRLLSFLGKPMMSSQNLAFLRKKFLMIHGFDINVVHAEDIELIVRANESGLKGLFNSKLTAITSARRLYTEGILITSFKQVYSQIFTLIFGPMKKRIFPYKMGGAYHHSKALLASASKNSHT